MGRIATAIGKYYVCKRVPHLAYECLEALGGNGYIEDNIMPRLFRQSPLNAIWEVGVLFLLRLGFFYLIHSGDTGLWKRHLFGCLTLLG